MHTTRRLAKYTFLALSFLSSVLELGPIIALAQEGESLVIVLLAGLAYQIGNLIAGMRSATAVLLPISALIAIGLAWFSRQSEVFFLGSVLFGSISLQRMRRSINASHGNTLGVTTLQKRSVRIAGFAVAGIVGLPVYPWMISLIGVAAVGAYFSFAHGTEEGKRNYRVRTNPLPIVMLIHQSHYFAYAYLIPVLLIVVFGSSPYLVGIGFVIGWISYASVESFVHSRRFATVFIVGHAVVAVSLACLGIFYFSLPIVLFAWFLSGFGGGTVFCLARLNKAAGSYRIDLEPWEDLGHVIGVVVSILLAIVLFNPFRGVFLAASVIALLAGLSMWLSAGRMPQPDADADNITSVL